MKIKLSTILLAVGMLLMALAVAILVFDHFAAKKYAADARDRADKLISLMPEADDGLVLDKSDNTMPTAELDGGDYIGVIEIPMYNSKLPVLAEWDKGEVAKQPCRFSGSIYDKSLVVGGSDGIGQFDFMKLITVNDTLYFTDMEGARFTYTVSAIEKIGDASAEALSDGDFDLVLFARSSTAFDYTIVKCKLK